mgnify:FL=1
MLAGSSLKVNFFKIKNKDGNLYATFEVLSPKKVLDGSNVIDLTKLNDKELFVGTDTFQKKDSLFCEKNSERIWSFGHVGYFALFNTLISEQADEIRKLLNVSSYWDAEWDSDGDILDGLSEEEIILILEKESKREKAYELFKKERADADKCENSTTGEHLSYIPVPKNKIDEIQFQKCCKCGKIFNVYSYDDFFKKYPELKKVMEV